MDGPDSSYSCLEIHRVEECFEAVQHVVSSHLETLPVDDGWAGLIILLLGDPHLLEGGEGSRSMMSAAHPLFTAGLACCTCWPLNAVNAGGLAWNCWGAGRGGWAGRTCWGCAGRGAGLCGWACWTGLKPNWSWGAAAC